MNAQRDQFKRFSLEKNFFWHGVLALNENGGQKYLLILTSAFFDVRMKKNVPGAPQIVGLYTNDIPPMPLSPTDTLTCTFVIENNMGLTTQRTTLVESSVTGTDLQKLIESSENVGKQILLTNEKGEWQFIQMGNVWGLRSVVLYVSHAVLNEHIKDI